MYVCVCRSREVGNVHVCVCWEVIRGVGGGGGGAEGKG